MSRKLTREDLQKIAEKRNHELISFENYQNVHSRISIQCKTCGHIWDPTVHQYKNAKKTGCPQCKMIILSKTHKGKVTSEETKKKIGIKSSQRPGSLTGKKKELHPRFKGGCARDMKNPSNADYVWKNQVRKRCNSRCVITGETVKKGQRFVCHHLNGFNKFQDQRYLPKNGVFLKREIHEEFHKKYKFGNNTEAEFAEFCEKFYNINWENRKKELNLL